MGYQRWLIKSGVGKFASAVFACLCTFSRIITFSREGGSAYRIVLA